jgi:glycosyltransferase involved in cell wall biosynthesis
LLSIDRRPCAASGELGQPDVSGRPELRFLRILVVADSKIPVPPKGYGGAERIISYLCNELAVRGHRVTLMAASGSRNYGRLVTYPWAGSRAYPWRVYCKLHFFGRALLEFRQRHEVVLAHGRLDYLLPLLRAGCPLVYHFHNPIAAEQVRSLQRYARSGLALISVSDAQRSGFDGPIWHTIHNAADTDRLENCGVPEGRYLSFLGRLTANKGVDTAIRVAERTGLPLRIAGNISDEPGGREFFEREVRSHLKGRIEWIGEIGDREKSTLLGQAIALLVPIRWDEPFGIGVAEALACGTPVIAFGRGAMPELVKDSVTGFLVSGEEEMANAVARLPSISRRACRDDAEARFSVGVMTDRYLQVINSILIK